MENPWQSLYQALACEGKTLAVSMPGFSFLGENPGGSMPGLAFVGKTLAVSMLGFGFWWEKTWQSLCQVLAFEGKSPCSLSGLSSGILINSGSLYARL